MFGTQTFSGSFDFAPTGGEIIMNAYQRIKIRPTEILTAQLQSAVMELNLLLARMSNMQPNLWTVNLQTLPLVQSQETYSLPAETVMITNAYITIGTGSDATDQIIWPLSQTEYASIANKASEGKPTTFWFNRAISPTITLYLVPDGEGPYTLNYYCVRQIQDATLANGVNVEVPYLWLDALVAGLSHRLARLYAQDLEQIRKQDADEAWMIAATQGVENVNLHITPSIGGYYTR